MGHNPDRKFRYDIGYIRRQLVWFSLKIVMRHIYGVISDPRRCF